MGQHLRHIGRDLRRRTRIFAFGLILAFLCLPATNLSAGTLNVAWDASSASGVTGYVVAYGTSSGQHLTRVDVGNRTTSSIANLTDGQRYYFVVYAYLADGTTSLPSMEVSGVVPSVTSPTPLPTPEPEPEPTPEPTPAPDDDEPDNSGCTYLLSATSLSFDAAGGTRTLNVTSAATCRWTVKTNVPWITITNGASGTGSATVTVRASGKRISGTRRTNLRLGSAAGGATIVVAQTGGSAAPRDVMRWDLNGDKKTDAAVWRPATGSWLGKTTRRDWGRQGDKPVAADYDGDGIGDYTVFQPGPAIWNVLRSRTRYADLWQFQWGLSDDIPVPFDYEGDGQADVAVWRPSTAMWYVKRSSERYATYFQVQWGARGDVPVPGDYDGDGKGDLALWRPSTGEWLILRSHMNYSTSHPFIVRWGSSGDRPVVGDYDGDGMSDVAVWRGAATATWHLLLSSGELLESKARVLSWGSTSTGDQPVVGDYDGDGKTDLTVRRGTTGVWHVSRSSKNFTMSLTIDIGDYNAQDIPLPR